MNTFNTLKTETTTNVWLTPRYVLDLLGQFDTDPCAATVRPWDCARVNYTVEHNGLLLPWEGRVWLNPPYGNEVGYQVVPTVRAGPSPVSVPLAGPHTLLPPGWRNAWEPAQRAELPCGLGQPGSSPPVHVAESGVWKGGSVMKPSIFSIQAAESKKNKN